MARLKYCDIVVSTLQCQDSVRSRQKHCDLNVPPWGLCCSRPLLLLPPWLTAAVLTQFELFFLFMSCFTALLQPDFAQ